MCATHDGNHFFRPLVKNDLSQIKKYYPDAKPGLIEKLYHAMTDHNTVRPATLLVILEGVTRFENDLWGNSAHGTTFAYSALQIHGGGSGEIFHRYQDPIMEHVHDAMLQFALAERNMKLVQGVLISYGYNLTHFCDCGCSITRDDDEYIESCEYKAVNHVRSYGESIGAPVHAVVTIDDIPIKLTDMHQYEIDAYKRIWTMLKNLPLQIFDGDRLLSESMSYMLNMKGGCNAQSKNSAGRDRVGTSQQTAYNPT